MVISPTIGKVFGVSGNLRGIAEGKWCQTGQDIRGIESHRRGKARGGSGISFGVTRERTLSFSVLLNRYPDSKSKVE